jgi:prevent-host-death family protein
MEARIVMASRFKQQCLALLDQVETTKVPVVVTKHGRPVARLVPLEDPGHAPTMGSVTLLADDDDAYFSTGENWEAEATPPSS